MTNLEEGSHDVYHNLHQAESSSLKQHALPLETSEPPRAVWEDDDDVLVDIASKGRLRKLRKAESETVLSHAEYEARLISQ